MTSYKHHHLRRRSKSPPDQEDVHTRPAHHADSNQTAFRNPWVQPKSLLASGQVLAQQWPFALAKSLEGHPINQVEVVKPNFTRENGSNIRATWLGHAVRESLRFLCPGLTQTCRVSLWSSLLRRARQLSRHASSLIQYGPHAPLQVRMLVRNADCPLPALSRSYHRCTSW
jgi:hypothetical protein